MSGSEKLSYLVPRNPSIKSWNDRVKLHFPLTENVVKMGLDACEEATNDKLKVYLRIKPCQVDFNPYSIFNNTLEAEAPNDNGACKKLSKNVGKLINKFHFTTIFSPESTQETVFQKCVLANLKRFISGRNDLLFAYGTTNAGKTFTMQGTVENPGMIPRAIQFIFKCLEENIDNMSWFQPHGYNELRLVDEEEYRRNIVHKNFILKLNLSKYQRHPELSWRSYKTDITACSTNDCSEAYENETFREMEKNLENLEYEVEDHGYSVWISMMEIYNEQIYDLLEVPSERGVRVKLGFAEDENGKVYIKNLRYIPVTNGHEAFQVFEFGRANLRLGPTALNYLSSRSHCICTLTLGRFSKKDNECIALSRFSFCDLAGAERVKKALAEGNRLVESKSINTSLSIFAKCLRVIRENQSNGEKRIVPYRESKLTRLFRDAMMGKETFSIIVNVTPEIHLFNETLNVLKFSAVARQIVPVNVVPKQKSIHLLGRRKMANGVYNANGNYKIDWEGDDVPVKEDEKNEIEFENLLEVIDQLKKQVADERERANEIESKTRKEFETKFSEVMNLAEKQRDLFECEYKRIRGVCDREKERLMKHYEERERKLKRKRIEGDGDYIEMETQIEALTNDLEILKSENSSLKELIQQMNSKSNNLQKKCSQLQMQLSEKEKMLRIYKRSMEETGNTEVVRELENELLQSKTKNEKLKELLDENEFDYKDLMVTNRLIKEENARLLGDLATTSDVVDDLKRELRDYEKMLSLKTNQIEHLESILKEESSEIFIEKHVKKNNVLDVIDLEENDDKKEEDEEEDGDKSVENESVSSEDSESMNYENDSRSEIEDSERKGNSSKKKKKTSNSRNESNREISTLRTEEENLVDYEELVKLVDQLREEVAEERERADNAEIRVRRELEAKFAEIVEENIVKEREMFEGEKQTLMESFERTKHNLTELYEDKMKNLMSKYNEQSEAVRSLREELKQVNTKKTSTDENEDEDKYKELIEKNQSLMNELDKYKKDNVRLENMLEEKDEKNKRPNVTIISNLIKKLEAVQLEDSLLKDARPEEEEAMVRVLEEKITKLVQEDETNRKEIELLRKENDQLKKGVTYSFRVDVSPSRGGTADETVSLEDLTNKLKEAVSKPKEKNEISLDDQQEAEKENVSGRELFAESESEVIENSRTPDRLSREIEKLSIVKSESKRTCKKNLSSLDNNLHPSLMKRCLRSKKVGKKQQKEPETDESEMYEDKLKDCKKEENSNRNNKGKKCTKKLFVDNDFDFVGDLESSFAEPEIPRLRPRRKL